ncbi:MAG: hypothetical protein EOP52_11325 [Sphingobacteriales bacterium]|nr:MAG: hypothetical protein EOP52_11325 [Sphingobacteriales bacterium]
MKTFLMICLCAGMGLTAQAQNGRFWQVNLGTDRRTAVLQQIHARGAVVMSDYPGPQVSLEKNIRVQGRFDGRDSVKMEFGFVSPIHKNQEDLLYAGTVFLPRESPESYAATFYEYFRKLQSRYGSPGSNQDFNAGDSITEAVFLNKITSGTEFRLGWRDTQTGVSRQLVYKPDLPEKLVLDYRMLDMMRMTRYLKDTSDY